MRISRVLVSAVALLSMAPGIAPSADADALSSATFHSKVVALYSFEPHTLGSANFPAKSAELDQFWSFVGAHAREALPLLRQELANPSNSSFFFYDGAKLLLSLSDDKADRALALRSLPKADLRGVQHNDYLTTVHWFAQNGFDTRQAAFRVLAFPDFKAFIPQHALTLGQNYSLIYMLFPMPETTFVDDLAKQLEAATDPTSQKSLLLALWYTVTPNGDAAIEAFAQRAGASKESVQYARQLQARRAGVSAARTASLRSLREERMKLMQEPISDEALLDFDKLTAQILAAK